MIAWVAMLITLLAVFLTTKKSIWCWPVGIANNVLWIVYAITTFQLPLVVLNAILLSLNVYGWRQWTKK